MIKATFVSTLFVVGAFQVSAQSAHTHDLTKLPVDVAAQVVELEKYGERFEAVIHGILEEALKPTWAFEENKSEQLPKKTDEPES